MVGGGAGAAQQRPGVPGRLESGSSGGSNEKAGLALSVLPDRPGLFPWVHSPQEVHWLYWLAGSALIDGLS